MSVPDRDDRAVEIADEIRRRPSEEREAALADLCGADESLRMAVLAHLPIPVFSSPLPVDGERDGDPSKDHGKERPGSPTTVDFAAFAARLGPDSKESIIPTAPALHVARLTPGAIVAERYRVAELLGHGGMGAVYRADDLKLGAPVALKFLPKGKTHDQERIQLFRNEVRVARQLSHPNLCRVFDIGEYGSETFLSMEYIDGEDLATLLRRIGRFPHEKALQIARQVCAGLDAVHRKGVVHCDLKPANIMLDGRGQVRITDFGIATPVESVSEGLIVGTPAYMAPELFRGSAPTVQSDIYALGLVLYEVFTGRMAFHAETLDEYARLHELQMPVEPTRFVGDIEPAIEQVILQCLHKDPARRPQSIQEVSASLPGWDPLAHAVAIGEMLSPESVAAAGSSSILSRRFSVAVLAAIVVGMMMVPLLAQFTFSLPWTPAVKPPAVLVEKARELLRRIDDGPPPRGTAYGFWFNEPFVRWVEQGRDGANYLQRLREATDGALWFWYRESPFLFNSHYRLGVVTPEEPERSLPGMRTVILDATGRLLRYESIPFPRGSAARVAPKKETNFAPLMAAAGLDDKRLTEIAPHDIPPMFADTQYAWEGFYHDADSTPVHIEAATLGGSIVFFKVVPSKETHAPIVDWRVDSQTYEAMVLAFLMIGGTRMAWRNLRRGRSDRIGARRLATFVFFTAILCWMLLTNHLPSFQIEFQRLMGAIAWTLLLSGCAWMYYIAIEPYVRQHWPQTEISWNRLLSGRVFDPVVAGHVLIGALCGILCAITWQIEAFAALKLHLPVPLGKAAEQTLLLGRGSVTGALLLCLLGSLGFGLICPTLLVILRAILKRNWLANLAFFATVTAVTIDWRWGSAVGWLFESVMALVLLLMLTRFGLLAVISCLFYVFVLTSTPMTISLGAWYSQIAVQSILLLAAIASAACFLAGRTLGVPSESSPSFP